jgi:hypothetical protein
VRAALLTTTQAQNFSVFLGLGGLSSLFGRRSTHNGTASLYLHNQSHVQTYSSMRPRDQIIRSEFDRYQCLLESPRLRTILQNHAMPRHDTIKPKIGTEYNPLSVLVNKQAICSSIIVAASCLASSSCHPTSSSTSRATSCCQTMLPASCAYEQ